MTGVSIDSALAVLWKSLGGNVSHLDRLRFMETGNHLPSVYDVAGMAQTLIGAANLAVAEVQAFRTATSAVPEVEVSGVEASAAFRSEALLSPKGWRLPAVWDSIAGDYQARDGWIRLHTNYLWHKEAALRALQLKKSQVDKAQVAAAVSEWSARELEAAVVGAGGCAARMFTEESWALDSIGSTTCSEPIVSFEMRHGAKSNLPPLATGALPLSGLRVLDLTRVIAGPACTRFLAAWGAQVLRIDPPGFEEVPAAIPDVTVGKKCAFLDLKDPTGRLHFEKLLCRAHVLVLGYRAEAPDRLGLGLERLYELNPSLVVARLNAYGWLGSLRSRRGFDSLVQMSAGIAARGAQVTASTKPVPLPAQALDHGAGYALAAGVCRALVTSASQGQNRLVSVSLIGVANFLKSHFREGRLGPEEKVGDFSGALMDHGSEWGPLVRVANPGRIGGMRGKWALQAGRLGAQKALFNT